MKKLLATLGAAAALLLAGFAGLSLWPPASREGPPRITGACQGSGPLLAGVASVALELPKPLTIGGFARLRWGADGQRDPLAVRALVIGEPGCQVGLVSLEILLVPGPLAEAVERSGRELGLDQVIVAATHTHAGPGGYWNSFLGGRLATAPWNAEVFARIADAAARALREAHAGRRPARLEAGTADARGVVWNRDGGELDGRLASVRLTGAGGATIGEVAVLGAHATMLGMKNRLVSGDWPGALMRSRSAPLLCFQGGNGDQTTHLPPGVEGTPEGYARAVASLLDAAPRSAPDAAPPLGAARAAVPLPAPAPGALPPLLRSAAGRLAGGMFPAEASVTALRLGPIVLVATPAEPTAAVAARWRAAAGPGAEVVSLAGGYAWYVETPERMARDEGETSRTFYGPELSARLQAAAALAARTARGGR